MADPASHHPTDFERYATWTVAALVALTLLCAAIQVAVVQPYLLPAGDGVRLSIDPPVDVPLPARPPRVDQLIGSAVTVTAVAPGSPAARAGLAYGDRVVRLQREGADAVDFTMQGSDGRARLDAWRERYWLGLRGPLEWRVSSASRESSLRIERPAAWSERSARTRRATSTNRAFSRSRRRF